MDFIVLIMSIYVSYFWFSRLVRSIFAVQSWQGAKLWGAVNTILFFLIFQSVESSYFAHRFQWRVSIFVVFLVTVLFHSGVIKNSLKNK
jgi:hypothetical protein